MTLYPVLTTYVLEKISSSSHVVGSIGNIKILYSTLLIPIIIGGILHHILSSRFRP